MATENRQEFEIDNDIPQQEREWVMQRIAWVLLAILLFAVAFGLFGRGGPISKVEASSADRTVRAEYNRFLRYHSPDVLQIRIKAISDSVRLKMESRYANQIQIERITPQPEREISTEDGVTFVFNTQPESDLHATFHFAPQKYGKLAGWVAAEDGSRLQVEQFVYP